MRFGRDLFHPSVETAVTARAPTKTAAFRAVCGVVRIREVDHRERSGPRRDRPGPGIRAQDVTPSRHEIEGARPTTEGPGHIADRPRSGHRIYDEITGTRVPTDHVCCATRGGHAVERCVASTRMAGGLRGEVPRRVGFQIGPAQHLPRLRRNHGLRGRGGRRHGRWYTAGPYERRPQREICESENLAREERSAEGSGGPSPGSGTARAA